MATLTASIVVLVALLGLFAPVASAAQPPPPHTGITAIAEPSGRLVGPRDTLLSGERRMLALNYDLTGQGSSVATLRGTPSMPTTTARATSHAYDPARSHCRRQPTDSVVDAPSSKVSAAIMNAPVGPRAPPIGQFIAAEGGGSTSDLLSNLASKAQATVGEGSGPVYGTAVHSEFASEINALGDSNLSTEVSYLDGEVVPYGTAGSVRLDVVEGNISEPEAVYDLKTGSASLTASRIAQIQANLPPGYQNIPVIEIRP
ncbi:MAG: hypothetical protein ACLPQS_17380 [Acidimicrobiales bacterium]